MRGMKIDFRSVKRYGGAAAFVAILALGWRYPYLAYCMFLNVAVGLCGALRHGGRHGCGTFCPRGAFYSLLPDTGRKVPAGLLKRKMSILVMIAMVAGLTACKTITFNAPEGALISYEGETLGTGTGSIKVNIIEEKKITIKKEGYATKVMNVTLASPNTIKVKLNRLISVTSKPSEADVYVNDLKVGTTPAKQISIDDSVGELK